MIAEQSTTPRHRSFEDVADGSLELLPTRAVHWGEGSIVSLADAVTASGASSVALLTSRSIGTQHDLLQRLEHALGCGFVATFDRIAAHAPEADVLAASEALARAGADVVVSFGGGSVIDAAKAAIRTLGRPILHVSVPTTLSGAELSSGYGVTRASPSGWFKQSHRDANVMPTVVIYDSTMTASTPAELWVSSGIKAIDHAVEGMLNSPELPIASTLALTGIRRMTESLPTSVVSLTDRTQSQIAAWECYFAPANMTYGLSHRLGHILGGSFGVPHSLTSAITLPGVLRLVGPNRPSVTEALARAFDTDSPTIMGVASRGVANSVRDAELAADVLRRLANRLNLPTKLRSVGVTYSDLTHVAELLLRHYPEAIESLGRSAPIQLDALLADIW